VICSCQFVHSRETGHNAVGVASDLSCSAKVGAGAPTLAEGRNPVGIEYFGSLRASHLDSRGGMKNASKRGRKDRFLPDYPVETERGG
jgi:hypothetical protein